MRLRLTLPPPTQPVDVVALGENSLDVLAVEGPDEAIAGKRRLARLELHPGGQMATAAVACARLGIRARYIGAFGDDPWGARSRTALEQAGVEVVAVEHPGRSSRSAVVLVDRRGDRQVFEWRDPGLAIDPVPADAIESGRIALIDATDPVASMAAARRAVAARIPTIVDVDRATAETETLLALIVVPAPLLEALTHTSAPGLGLERLAVRFPEAAALIVTLGEQGSLCRAGGVEIATDGFPVDVVDTTGAGDAFRGAFAAAWVLGAGTAPLESMLSFANAAAALNCRGFGAQSGLPSVAEIQALVTARAHARSN
jgi:sulfofructose kinase